MSGDFLPVVYGICLLMCTGNGVVGDECLRSLRDGVDWQSWRCHGIFNKLVSLLHHGPLFASVARGKNA